MFSKVARHSILEKETDENLLLRYQQDKHPACANELYARYIHLIYGAALKYLRHQEKSRELAMEIFQKLLVLENAEEVRSLNYWIYTMVKNECFSKKRKDIVEEHREDSWKLIENNSQKTIKNEGYLRLINDEDVEDKNPIRESINQLPEEQKICLELFYYKELSYKSIVEKTGYELNQVKSFIQNGKRNLKIMLEKTLSR